MINVPEKQTLYLEFVYLEVETVVNMSAEYVTLTGVTCDKSNAS